MDWNQKNKVPWWICYLELSTETKKKKKKKVKQKNTFLKYNPGNEQCHK